MNTRVVITFQYEGMHKWPEAKDLYPDVAFLSDPHRHMFHFRMEKEVHHDDRDIEFIRWKREVTRYLDWRFSNGAQFLDFGSMSCEQIAKDLLNRFDCYRVEVWEDGENGAIVEQ